MDGMWREFYVRGLNVLRVLCDWWYVMKFIVMGGMW